MNRVVKTVLARSDLAIHRILKGRAYTRSPVREYSYIYMQLQYVSSRSVVEQNSSKHARNDIAVAQSMALETAPKAKQQ